MSLTRNGSFVLKKMRFSKVFIRKIKKKYFFSEMNILNEHKKLNEQTNEYINEYKIKNAPIEVGA